MKDPLFSLIQSLSTAEKRMFVISQQRYKSEQENISLTLYKALNSTREYDENLFLKKHKKKSFAVPKQYAYNKNRLMDELLGALRSGRKNSPTWTLLQELESAKLLLERKIYVYGLKQLRKAKKMAIAGENFEVLLEILREERTIVLKLQEKNWVAEAEGLLDNMALVANKIQWKYKYLRWKDRLFIRVRQTGRPRDEELKEEVRNVFKKKKVRDPKKSFGFDARQNYLFAKALYEQLLGDWNKAYKWYAKHIKWWGKYPEIQKRRKVHYLNALNNFLSMSHSLKIFDKYEEALDLLTNYPCNSGAEKTSRDHSLLLNQLYNHIRKGEWEKAILIEQAYKNRFEEFQAEHLISRQIAYALSLAWLNHILGHIENAQKWNQEVLNMSKTNVRQGLQAFARLYVLVLESEREEPNQTSMESAFRRAYRYLRENRSEQPFEDFLLNCMKQVTKMEVGVDWTAQYKNWLTELEEIARAPENKFAEGFRIAWLWLQSKVEGVPLKELVVRGAGY